MDILITSIIGAFSTFVVSFITWFFARRKNDAEAKGTELDNVEKAIAVWREMAESLELKLKESLDSQEKQREMNGLLQQELSEIKRQVKLLLCENEKLKRMVSDINIKS